MFIKRNIQTLREWWQSPVTIKDRAVGALVGGIGGFWIGVFGRVGLGATPAPFGEVVIWASVIAVCGVVTGIVFPSLWLLFFSRFQSSVAATK